VCLFIIYLCILLTSLSAKTLEKAKNLTAINEETNSSNVPQETEVILEYLFSALQDKVCRFYLNKIHGNELLFRIPLFVGQRPRPLLGYVSVFLPSLAPKFLMRFSISSQFILSLRQSSPTCQPWRRALGMAHVLLALSWQGEI
jgi:hypothetical protein